MAPNLVVRSDSWQDLSHNHAYLAEDRERRREFIKQASVPPDASSSRIEHLSHSSIPSYLNINNNNNNEHLLIRLRQRSYLNQRSSNSMLSTWSSNLSNSIDLQVPSLPVASEAEMQDKQETTKRELSFGLKSFKSRFERRFQARSRQSTSSPFARSWSSLSEQVNSKLTHLGHSWKNFLYNYQHQHKTTSSSSSSQVNDNNVQNNSELLDEQTQLSHIRSRLTAEWISRHARQQDGDLQQKIRPKSIQLPTIKTTTTTTTQLNELNEEDNEYFEELNRQLREAQLANKTSSQSTGCATAAHLSPAESNCSTETTTTATLVDSSLQAMNANRLLLSPPPPTQIATSDYWSATSGSGSGAMVRQLQEHSKDYYLAAQMEQQQQQEHFHQQLSPTDEQMMQLPVGEDDYDDYAVPSDESCCRLDRSQVELVQLIGEGQKGYVFLGKLQSRNGATIIDVAIKTLKYETEALIERLMSEAAMMKQLEHPHIIKFIGMCPETPALIAMELAKFGELKHYLKLNAHAIRVSQLVLFAFQISTALSYLESKNYVHRDVAARNVLVCAHNCVKLADFGLSRNLQTVSHQASQTPTQFAADDQQQLYVAAPRVKLPVRWLAPESLVFRRFTSASDVWMFAVFTWELFQLGLARPWPALRNNQVLLAIESGRRLIRPDACPQRLYQLMLKCWSYAPVQRPKFREIKQSIWSIYLNERTREQLELERFEREKQQSRHLQQQQSHSRHSMTILNSSPLGNHHLTSATPPQLMPSPTMSSGNAGANYAPTSNYSTGTTSTSTDHQRSTSPGSSAFGSMVRASAGSHRKRQLDSPQVNATAVTPQPVDRSEVLRAQQVRFLARQSPDARAPPPTRRQPHVLQKQRSQGAIGAPLDQSYYQPAYYAQPVQVFPEANTRGRLQRRPLDDAALEQRAGAAHQRLYSLAQQHPNYQHDDPRGAWPEVEDDVIQHQVDQTHRKRFLDSISPALTADEGHHQHHQHQLRHASMEPNYEGVAKVATPTRPGQVAMLRTNYERSTQASSISPASFRQLTSSPALTAQSPSGRPASWASRRPYSESPLPVQPAPRPSQAPTDQLGQMLQALRITPMKAKLRSPPEQTVRVLAPAGAPAETGSEMIKKPTTTTTSSRLQLHERLLGLGIRASPTPQRQQQQQQQQQQQAGHRGEGVEQRLRQQRSVEMVDSSLELLESLMSPPGISLAARRRK